MLALQEELTSTENKISFARQTFNDAVTAYNNGNAPAIQAFEHHDAPRQHVLGPFEGCQTTAWYPSEHIQLTEIGFGTTK